MLGRIFIDTNIVIYALGSTSTRTHLAASLFSTAFPGMTALLSPPALEAGGDTLYSEDMQSGQEIEGQLRIVNPFI